MRRVAGVRWLGGAALGLAAAAAAFAQGYGPPSPNGYYQPPAVRQAGATAEVDRKRLAAMADRLAPQRPGVVDAYVLVVALDSDPVFGREARATADVLAQRYDAQGRTLLLAGLDGRSFDPLPKGTPDTLLEALNRIGAVMNPAEDALILYITAHGSPDGVVYRQNEQVLGTISPIWLNAALARAKIDRRVVMISACFSGIFVPVLASANGAVLTAAASDRTSFGCASDNDWTFFGDALANHALRKGQPLAAAFGEAQKQIGAWEAGAKLIPSRPQIAVGAQVAGWLKPLEARMPKLAGVPVGRPAVDAIELAVAANH